MNDRLNEHVQNSAMGTRVELIDIDLGDQIIRLVPTPLRRIVDGKTEAISVRWRGNVYTPHPLETEGWEWNSQAAAPTPKLRIANVDLSGTALNLQYGDLIGKTLTRWVTFDRFLDDGIDPDPDAHFRQEIYKIDRKSGQNKLTVEYELASTLDQAGRLLPNRTVNKNQCPWRYRFWDGLEFDYTNATCPYAGAQLYDFNGNPTSEPANDVCGKRLSDCKLRFGNATLPFGGFPGVNRVR